MLTLHNRSQPHVLVVVVVVVVLTIMSVSQLVIWSVTSEMKCSWKESSAAQSTSAGGKLQSHSGQPASRPAFWYCRISLSWYVQILRRYYLPQLWTYHLVWYLNTDYVHCLTGSFNSLRAYTLPADAYEMPVSSGQSIGRNVTVNRVASRGLWTRLPSQSLSRPQPLHISTLSCSTGCLTTLITLTPWHKVFRIGCEFLNSFRKSVS